MSDTSTEKAVTLRRAAALIRERAEEPVAQPERWPQAVALPLAAWLDTAGADLWAHGPLHCADGCMECDDDLWMPHARAALAVARAYLGVAP